MTTEIATTNTITEAGIVANYHAAQQVFTDYQQRKSSNSLRAQYSDLTTFCEYMNAAGIVCDGPEQLQNHPESWQGMSWGLVAGFVQWMLGQGLALSSINRKLSTVKVYAGLAAHAGVISGNDLALIKSVKGYAAKEWKNVDRKRKAEGSATRTGAKKATNKRITPAQARQLKIQPDSPQGRRDAVIMALLLDHGLRVGELAALLTVDVDLTAGVLRFYRAKVGKTQTHELTKDAKAALIAYMPDAPALGPLLRGSSQGGELTAPGMSERALTARVCELGSRLGIEDLSAHDLRHYWTTQAIRKGSDPFAVMQAGGWTSMATVQKYVDETKIANEGIKQD